MKNDTDWGSLIGAIAIFAVFVLLPLIARLLKVKKYQTTQPKSTEEREEIEREIESEFDVLSQKKKAHRQKKIPEPLMVIEPVPEVEEKLPPRQPELERETTVETRIPLTQIVKDLPDAAQAIILAEIIGSPKALQPRPETLLIFRH